MERRIRKKGGGGGEVDANGNKVVTLQQWNGGGG